MRINDNLKIGARSFKTALAVMICLLISYFIKDTDGSFSTVSALICMLPTYEESKVVGIGRIIATILSFIAGFTVLVFYTFIPNSYQLVRVFLIPVVILILIKICLIIKYERSIVLCCAVFILLTVSSSVSLDNIIPYTLIRLIETTIGVGVALLINKFILPYKPTKK